MPRDTLKLKKPLDAAGGPAKPRTTRARDAQRRLHTGLAKLAQPMAPPAEESRAKPQRPKKKPRPPAGRTARGPGPAPREGGKGREADGRPAPRTAPRTGVQAPAPRSAPRTAPATAAQAPRPRPAPADENADPRLSKLMGERGLCSRREADEWIENGWVTVNGQVVTELGTRVPRDARIEIDRAAAKHQSEQVTILLNKPVGYVSGQPEDDHPPAMVLIKPENRWAEDPSPIEFKRGHLRGLAPAGRLDIDSTGLLVFTQDGRVAKRLVGGDSEVEKEYLVRVEGSLTEEGLERLRHGLELDGVKLKPARVSWANEDQLRFVLREGRKRQIRRMCEMVGLRVTGLKRVRSGGVPLGKLPVGQWRYLRRDEKF